MSGVTLTQLSKRFGDFTAVDALDLDIADGEFVTLLGPSGCGKTTTLRCLAGLERPSSGRIAIGGEIVADADSRRFVPPDKRNIGMVFQSYALWPHMTVRGNVAYPMKLRGMKRSAIPMAVDRLLETVGLSALAQRGCTELSGGQQQRVALARALAREPRLLLFDEPLSNLDTALRTSLRAGIREAHDLNGTTSIYVTHDQEEAVVLSDRIAVMCDGVLQQLGTPREVYAHPANSFVARFLGFDNIFSAELTGVLPGAFTAVPTGGGPAITVDQDAPGRVGDVVELAFRARHLRVTATPSEDVMKLSGRVRRIAYLGSHSEVVVDVAGLEALAIVNDHDLASLGGRPPKPDDLVPLALSPHHVVALSAVPGDAASNAGAPASSEARVTAEA